VSVIVFGFLQQMIVNMVNKSNDKLKRGDSKKRGPQAPREGGRKKKQVN